MKPILHMGLGWDDFHLRALVEAGFETRDVILVARTNANTGWAKRAAPGAEIVYLPYRAALDSNPVVGTTVRPAFRRAARAAGLEPWDVILGERALRRRPADVAISFANLAAEKLTDVVTGPTIAIAEFTVTSEIILSGLVAAAGGAAFWPRTLRHPSDRFALFSNPRSIAPLPRAVVAEVPADEARTLLAAAVEGTAKPSYFAQNARAEGPRELYRLVSDRIREFAVDRGANLQLPTVRDYTRLPWLNVVRGRRNIARYRDRAWQPKPTGPYVLFPFHVQPESTVDVQAPEWRDQAHAALHMADALARRGVTLVVKEHSNFIWRRDPSFWVGLDAHPNVVPVDPTSNTAELMADALWTFTPTGTAGLEAALRGLRVVMGAPMSWTALPNVAHAGDPVALDAFIDAAGWETLRADPAETERWFRDVYLANSWPGVALDPPRFPAVMEPANLKLFGVAYAEAAHAVQAAAHPAG